MCRQVALKARVGQVDVHRMVGASMERVVDVGAFDVGVVDVGVFKIMPLLWGACSPLHHRQAWQTCRASVPMRSMQATDAAGNVGSPTSVAFRTDLEPPVISNVTAPAATQESTVSIAYTVGDLCAGFPAGVGARLSEHGCALCAVRQLTTCTSTVDRKWAVEPGHEGPPCSAAPLHARDGGVCGQSDEKGNEQ